MKKLIEKLAAGLLHPATPSPLFLESLLKYTKPAPTKQAPIDSPLGARSSRALALYRQLPPNGAARRAVYVLLCLAEYAPGVEDELRLSLQRAALAFPVPYLTSLPVLRQSLPNQVYQVLQRVYEASLRYRKIVLESSAPRSQTHSFFLSACAPVIREYEQTVVASEVDFLKFHCKMYPIYCKLKEMDHVNDLITDGQCSMRMRDRATENGCSPAVSPFTEYKIAGSRHLSIFDELLKYDDIAYRVYNICTASYCLTGVFYDPCSEYFIKDHTLDYGRIPPILPHDLAEKIAYIGKYMSFLRQSEHPPEIVKTANSIDISKRSLQSRIRRLLKYTNGLLMSNFIKKYRIPDLLEFIRAVFLSGRGDFIEHLFVLLKELKSSSRRDVLTTLESALQDAFPGSPFASTVDIFLKSEQEGADGAGLAEAFGLYCRVDYPVTVLLEEEFVLKLVYIFKFLWKLKRVDHLSRRIGRAEYVNFINRLMFYVFNEALSSFCVPEMVSAWDDSSLALDILRAALNKRLDFAMEKLFINTQAKRIEYLLFYMEKAFVGAGKTGVFDDTEIQAALRAFYENTSGALGNTCLHGIGEFLRTS